MRFYFSSARPATARRASGSGSFAKERYAVCPLESSSSIFRSSALEGAVSPLRQNIVAPVVDARTFDMSCSPATFFGWAAARRAGGSGIRRSYLGY